LQKSTFIFNQIASRLAREKKLQNQLEIVLEGALDLTNADAGTLYSVVNGDHLNFEVVINRTLEICICGKDINFKQIPLYKNGEANSTLMVVNSVLDLSIKIDDVYSVNGYNCSGSRAFDATSGYKTKSTMTVPVKNYDKQIIGVIQLINAQDEKGDLRVFNDQDRELLELFTSQTAFTLSSKLLIDKQNKLFRTLSSR
jgi:GAF domain-containing protein